MSCLFHQLSTHSAFILFRATHRVVGFTRLSVLPWRRVVSYNGVRTTDSESISAKLSLHCYSSSSSSLPSPAPKRKSRSRKSKVAMDEEKQDFYVVRKGDLVGVYKTLSECQAQVGTSVCDPPVSVFKGCSLPEEAQDFLRSRGLQNALYTIKASDLKEDLFGSLVPCRFQEPSSVSSEMLTNDQPQKRPSDAPGSENVMDDSTPIATDSVVEQLKLDSVSSESSSCVLEFDGASKGNPGQAGAGVVLRADDGSVICKLHQGLGVATCNAAEYRAIILGLKSALERGYTSIRVQGDSKLVCMQLQGLWKVSNENMAKLHAEAKQLKDKFVCFQINHVLRALNSDADAQANLGIKLADGQVEEDIQSEPTN